MKKIIITLGLIGLIGFAAWSIPNTTTKSIHQSDTISTPAPELGPRAHKLLPNLKNAQVVVPDRPHDPSEVFSENKAQTIQRTRQFTVNTNTLGFRDQELANQPPIEVVCVGDSVTFGWGVAGDESYPAQIEKFLNIGVLNTGVPALKPEHVEAYIQSILLSIAPTQPKVLLVAMRPNWMTPNPLQGYVQTMKRIHNTLSQQGIQMGIILPPLASFDPKGRSNNAREVDFIKRELSQIEILDTTPIFDANLPEGGVSLQLNHGKQQMIDRTSKEVLAEGAQPKPPQSLAPEIVAMFETNHSIKEPLFYDGGHPDAEGFVLFGQTVAKWLQDLGWV